MIQKEAKLEDKNELVDLMAQSKSTLTLHNGKKVKIGYLLGATQDKLDYLIVKYEQYKKSLKPKEGEEYTDEAVNKGNKYTRQFYAKMVAAILLNSYWGIKFLWWFKWRQIYYFSDWSGTDYLAVITEAKKKAQEQEYSLAMVFLMDMTTTWTAMTKKEAEEYRHELELAREAQLLRNSQA